jgi:hypothetical protein
MPQVEIIACLNELFNAQAQDVRSTLHKYGASLKPLCEPMFWCAVNGVARGEAEAFFRDFGKLKGVQNVTYANPWDIYP